MDFTAVEERDEFGCEVKADCLSGYECVNGTCTRQQAGGDPLPGDPQSGDSVAGDSVAGDSVAGDPVAGDPVAGDPVAGDPVAGDPLPGDPVPGDPVPTAATSSTELCAAGGQVSSSGYRGFGCLSPVGPGGQMSTNSSYKLIPGPAHIVEVE